MTAAYHHFLSDIQYSAWANRRLLDACAALVAEELERDLRISHTSILITLSHIYDGERVWLDGIRDTPDLGTYVLPQGPSLQLTLEELKQHWPKLWEGYLGWIQGPTGSSGGLDSEVVVQLPDCSPRFPRWKILRHVLDHSQFHRGQIVAMIRTLGYCPPAINRMDYFLDESGR